jgi:hypothetical protein
MYVSTHVVQELHRQRVEELERAAAVRRLLPAPRGTRRRLRLAFHRPGRHARLDPAAGR